MAIKVESLTYKDTEYELIPPAPTSTERGGIIASTKTDDYTTEVKLGSDGKLYVPEGVSPFKGVFNSGSIDELRTYGVYWAQFNKDSTSITGTQPPYVNTQFGYFEVLRAYKAGTDCMQRFNEYFGGVVHTRVYVNGGWLDWETYNLGNYLPLSGGSLTGGVDFKGNSKYLSFYDDGNVRRLALWADNEGGNIRLSPPAAYSHYWEIDAYNGNLRVRDSSGNNTYTFKSYANGGRGGTIGNISLATSSSALIGTASSGFNTTIDDKYHSLYLTGSVGSSGTMNLMFDMRYPRAGLSVSQSMAHGNSSIKFTVSGNQLTSSGSSNGVSVYGIYYS